MILYKYFPPARVDVVQSGKICFSSPNNLNDPFELKPPIRLYKSQQDLNEMLEVLYPGLLDEEYERLPESIKVVLDKNYFASQMAKAFPAIADFSSSAIKDLVPLLQKKFHDSVASVLGVLCLTEDPDSLLMWAHYSESHAGFVMGFDSGNGYFDQRISESDELRHLRKVSYSDERAVLDFNDGSGVELFLTKSKHWEYEKEWRMLMPLSDANQVVGLGSAKACLFEYSAKAVVSIIFGARMRDEHKQKIILAMNSRGDFFNCSLYQSSVDDKLYKLNINKYD